MFPLLVATNDSAWSWLGVSVRVWRLSALIIHSHLSRKENNPMAAEHSTYPLPDLLLRWKRGEITVEQLAGYLLQHVILHERRLTQIEKTAGRPPGETE